MQFCKIDYEALVGNYPLDLFCKQRKMIYTHVHAPGGTLPAEYMFQNVWLAIVVAWSTRTATRLGCDILVSEGSWDGMVRRG